MSPLTVELKDRHRSLRQAWARLCEVWDDERSRRFESEHALPIDERTSAFLPVFTRASLEIDRALKECP